MAVTPFRHRYTFDDYLGVEEMSRVRHESQDRRRVEVMSRDAGDAWRSWIHEAGDEVELPSLGLTFSIDDVYELAGVRVGEGPCVS